ncbi:MAG: hypothetical protein GTN89_07315 [Acidobacteria bacterium]|nr:hypothetical protein [Acidobacteriota bacterium]NIM63289.1 hypothetical protein [Acidobacteriota bacterium]NIO59136.1 hypothetical protein [Acidobacteriota bacterium]NIQ30168.1 hypothetical protein [Acidobacteriota bacterium]NIQ85036.1 hypothetical protein [Acidobacteriota bacterium]
MTVCTISLCAAILLASLPTTASTELKEGQSFPALVLPSLESGEPLSIADFRGRKVVLHVFASW